MEPLKKSLRPRPRPRIQTGKKTLRNRVVWADENFKDPYSELTVTVPWGEGYAVIPTVDANGNKLSTEEALEKTLEKKLLTSKGNPLDFITNEELPVFSTEEEANRYAQWRSDSMFDPEAIATGFDREPTQIFPDAPPPEVDNRSITNKVINKLNRLLAYTGIKAYRGEIEGFDEGALVEQRPMSFSGVAAPDTKGLSYSEIILDSILGLENNYETGVEGIVKQFNQDRVGFLKTIGKTIYDETVDFISSPVDMQGLEKVNPMVAPELKVAEFGVNIANELKQAVERLSSQDLNTRLQSMFGVDYNNATDDQVSKARESVLGDGLIVAEVIPAVRAASKAVPGEVKADLMGQTKALLEGDIVEFSQTSSKPPKGVSANVPGMFPKRVVDPDDAEPLSASEIEFYETQDKFIDLQNQKSIKFTDAFAAPALVNRELDTETYFTDSGELYRNLEEVAGGPAHQTFIPEFRPGNPDVKNDILTDEQYTQFRNSQDPEYILNQALGDASNIDVNRDDFWFTDKNEAGKVIAMANQKDLGDVVKPEYFKQVQSDIKESVEFAFKSNIDNLDPTDVFTLVGLLKKQDAINSGLDTSTSEFNAIRIGVNNTIEKIIEDLKLTDNILVSDPRDYIKNSYKKPGEYIIDVTPRKKNIDVDTQLPYYETAKGMYTENGDLKYRFSTVFGVEPKDSGIFYGAPDGQSFSLDIEQVIKDHLRGKLNTTETIADRSLDELSDMYANQYLKNVKSSDKISDSNLKYIAADVIMDVFEKTNKKVIPGGVIIKALQEDPRVNNKTIPPYFLTDEFKNRVFKNDKTGGPGMFDLPESDFESLTIEYANRSPKIKYTQSNIDYPNYQRQESEFGGNFFGGEAIDYKESQITATDRKTNQSPFTAILTHYDPGTLAHTRVSTVDPTKAPLLGSGKSLELYKSIIGSEPFKLVQEIQSDLVSKGIQKFKKLKVDSDTVKKIFNRNIGISSRSSLRFPAYNANQDLIEKYGIDNYELDLEKGEEVFETVAAALEDFANQPDGKDVVMAKQKYDELTRKTVDAQELKYKNLSVPEKFDMLFDAIIQESTLENYASIKNKIIAGNMTNEEIKEGLDLIFRSYDPSDSKVYDIRSFLLAYNDFKRNGAIPNNPDILENAKNIYMDSLRKDYARYLNNFTSNLNNIDKSQVNPDGIPNFSAQAKINDAALGNPSRFKDAPIKVKDTKGIEDYVSLIVQNLINNADADGIDKIVFPPVDRILERRFGGEKLTYALQNKSWSRDTGKVTDGHPLYKAYAIALPKVLDQFEKTYGIKIYRDVELPYGKSGRDLNNKGIIIDISDMKKKFDLSRPGFAKGGTVMNKQMEMAFMKQGGIRDDGMKKDPVSGNNIPPGSMATEVRDDIPAMLSEGEYVVPADVLRYYGVNFFENLRNQAKNGLQTMEQNGRIGGTPMTQQDVARNMQQPMAAAQGAMMQSPMRIQQQPAPQAMGNTMQPIQGFNSASVVTPNPMPSTVNPANLYAKASFQNTSSYQQNLAKAQEEQKSQSVTTMVKHYSNNGDSVMIRYDQLPGGSPAPAPGQESELAKYPMTELQYATYKKTQQQSQGSDKKPNPFDKPKVDTIGPLKDIAAKDAIGLKEEVSKMIKGPKESFLNKLGTIPNVINTADQARNLAEIRAIAKYKESLGGEENIKLAGELRDIVNAAIKGNTGLEILDGLNLMSGENIYKDIIGYESGDSQPSLPNASNGQTREYMFVDDDGNPLTPSDYKFAEALAGTYGWQAKYYASQQNSSMILARKGIEDNTIFGSNSAGSFMGTGSGTGGGTGGDTGGDTGGGAEAARLAAVERQKAIEEVKKEQETDPTEELEVRPGGEDRGLDEGGLMTTPKKKKRGRPKKSGLAGKK